MKADVLFSEAVKWVIRKAYGPPKDCGNTATATTLSSIYFWRPV